MHLINQCVTTKKNARDTIYQKHYEYQCRLNAKLERKLQQKCQFRTRSTKI